MQFNEYQVWAGTEASAHAVAAAEEQARAQAFRDDDDDERERPRLLTVDKGIATVRIKGPLVNSASWINEYYGMTGYPEIKEALIHAAKDVGVDHIVLDVDSGGGSVAGLDDTAQLISLISRSVKPVDAYVSGNAYSAAYWLASQAGSITASRSSGLGSIGVITTHFDYTKALEKDGVKVTVVRAGKFKALASPYEELSEVAREQIEADAKAHYDIFIESVAEGRGKSATYVDTVMGQGREFIGKAGLEVGLVDAIDTQGAFMSQILNKTLALDNNYSYTSNMSRLTQMESSEVKMNTVLTEQDIAALASGVAIPAAAEVETADAAAEVDAGVEMAAAAEEVQASEENAPAAESPDTAWLKEQVKELQAELVSVRVELSRANEKLADATLTLKPLQDIAAKAINNMRVACRATPLEMDAMTPAQVLSEHTAIQASFAKQFPVGGVASTNVAAEAEKSAKTPSVDSNFAAKIKAVRGQK